MSSNANGIAVGITCIILLSFAFVGAIITAFSRRNLRYQEQTLQDEEAARVDHPNQHDRSTVDRVRKNADLPPPPVPPKPQPNVDLESNTSPLTKLPRFKTRKSLSLSKPLPSELDMRECSNETASFISLPSPLKTQRFSFTVTSPSHKSRPSTLGTLSSVESVLEQYEKEADIAAESEQHKVNSIDTPNGAEGSKVASSQDEGGDKSVIQDATIHAARQHNEGEPGPSVIQGDRPERPAEKE